MLADYVDRAIVPAQQRLVSELHYLVGAAAQFKQRPSADSLLSLKEQALQVAKAHAAGQALAFGPIHSLSVDTDLDFPIDASGIDLTIRELEDKPVNELISQPATPSLGGLQAMNYLLQSDVPESYDINTRRYLYVLSRRMEDAASLLLASWQQGIDEQPAYAQVFSGAGDADNTSYLSSQSALEEVVRTWLGTLEVLAYETLPDTLALIGTEDETVEDEVVNENSLTIMAASIQGIVSGYQVLENNLAKSIAGLMTARQLLVDKILPSVSINEATLPATAGQRAAVAGLATAWNRTSSAYEEAPPNLSAKGIADHDAGDEAFEESFVLSSDHPNAGLGPQFNNTSCVSCHIRNGRGLPVAGQLLLRVSQSVNDSAEPDTSQPLGSQRNTPPVEILGNQIQDFAVAGVVPEAQVDIEWVESSGKYPDGTTYSLRSPSFKVTVAHTGKLLPDSIDISPRIPPAVYGLGLLEAIEEKDILALADPGDKNGDGISGRANRVWNETMQDYSLGRFGWKANSPNLLQQTADAYLNDMGIHSSMFPAEDGSIEIDDTTLMAATAYSQTLAVPARGSVNDPQVMHGEQLFSDVGCVACHVDSYVTGEHTYPSISGQTIQPYTDLLLHDMGEALADGRADYEANGREWRTPALWGIGLAQTVLPYAGFLHDGRARTLEEAILWHGGEAEKSALAFKQLDATARADLLRFLSSL